MFSSLRSRIFLPGSTGTGSQNDPLLIVKNLSCVDGGRNTCVTSTTQCTLETKQDGGQGTIFQFVYSKQSQNQRITLPVKNQSGKKNLYEVNFERWG